MTRRTTVVQAAWLVVLGGMMAGCPYGSFRKPAVTVDTGKARIEAASRLLQAAEDPNPATRVYAIEAIADVLPERAAPIVLQGLRDEEPRVRSAAAMAAGELELASAKEHLQEMAMFKTKGAENEKRVFCSVLGALHRMGSTKQSYELRDLLYDAMEDVRGQAAVALGLTGDPRAIPLLKRRLEVERTPLVIIQIIEAAARLGDRVAIAKLEGHAHLPTDSGISAIEAIGRLGIPGAADLLRSIAEKKEQSPLRKVVAYGSMARLGEVPDGAYEYCARAVRQPQSVLQRAFGPYGMKVDPQEVMRLQRCAAVSLGWMRRNEAVGDLQAALVKTANGDIRVAAAMSILRIVNPAPAARALPATPAKQEPPDSPTRKQPRKPRIQSADAKD